MPRDVGRGLAQHQGQRALDLRRQRRRRVVVERDRGGFEQQARGGELGGKVGGAEAGDRGADFGQRVARDFLRLGDFGARCGGVAIDQLAREFKLQRDQRQRVPEQVVQVAADALAFGGGGEPAYLVVRESQRGFVLAFALLDADDDRDHHRHRRQPHHRLPRIADPQGFGHDRGAQHQHAREVMQQAEAPAACRRQHHATEHEVAQPRRIPGQQRHAQRHHRQRIPGRAATRRNQRLRVEEQEQRERCDRQQQPAQAVAHPERRGDEHPGRPQQVDEFGPRRLAAAHRVGQARVGRGREPGTKRFHAAMLLQARAISRGGAGAARQATGTPR